MENCCPDVYLTTSQLTCMETTIIAETSQKILAMSLTCSGKNNTEIEQLCSANYTSKQTFRLPPVTSRRTNLTYRNIFCAECHNDTDVESWFPSINCDQNVDLNYLSSYEEILTKAAKHNCTVKYESEAHKIACSPQVEDSQFTELIIHECNKTGTWDVYDEDIATACSLDVNNYMFVPSTLYFPPEKNYINIFCKMCNPPDNFGEGYTPLERLYSASDTDVDPMFTACNLYEQTPLLFPFKNVFCFFLSRQNKTKNHTIEFTINDGTVTITNDTAAYNLNLDIQSLFPIPIFDTSSKRIKTVSEYLKSLVNENGKHVDVERLLHFHFLHYGFQKRCTKMTDIQGRGNQISCECEIQCIKRQTCCADFAFTKPVSLATDFGFSRPLQLIDRCYGNYSGNISELCEADRNKNDVVSLFPVSNWNAIGDSVFKNIYCFACNEISFTYENASEFVQNIQPRGFQILCNFVPNLTPFSSIEDVIGVLSRANAENMTSKSCNITIDIDLYDSGDIDGDVIHSCNVTGKWKSYDGDIEWACRNYPQSITPFLKLSLAYSNIFCQICNMDESKIDSGYSEEHSCNVTNIYAEVDPVMEAFCHNQSSIITMLPWKNTFCKHCVSDQRDNICKPVDGINSQEVNDIGPYSGLSVGDDGGIGEGYPGGDYTDDDYTDGDEFQRNVYRMIFTVEISQEQSDRRNKFDHYIDCEKNEIFDPKLVCK